MALVLFLIQVFIISFSGAIQPGPVTTSAITMGTRNRWAGVLPAIGHGIIEFPLMVLIILGLGEIFQKTTAQQSESQAASSSFLRLYQCSNHQPPDVQRNLSNNSRPRRNRPHRLKSLLFNMVGDDGAAFGDQSDKIRHLCLCVFRGCSLVCRFDLGDGVVAGQLSRHNAVRPEASVRYCENLRRSHAVVRSLFYLRRRWYVD